jgi:hypothetical protein
VKRRSLEDLHFYLDTQIEDVIIVMYVEDNIFEITPIEGVSCLSVLSVLHHWGKSSVIEKLRSANQTQARLV